MTSPLRISRLLLSRERELRCLLLFNWPCWDSSIDLAPWIFEIAGIVFPQFMNHRAGDDRRKPLFEQSIYHSRFFKIAPLKCHPDLLQKSVRTFLFDFIQETVLGSARF